MPAAFSADRFPSGGAARGLDLSRRRLLLSAPLVLTVPLLGGCATAVPTSTHLADALGSRLSAGDRAGFYALFAGSAGAQAVALRMFDNLLDSGATIAAASSDRLSVTWHLPGEPPVVSLATVTLAGAVVDAIEPVSTGTEWLSDPMTVHAEASLVVASARQDESARWLTAARAGLAALATVWPAGQRRTEPLIVLAPSDLVGFARYAGADAQTTAAVTVVPGTTASQGVRVVVNPVAATNAVTDAATLTHEAVHAAMGSPRLTGTPGWLLEGIAEALTARAHPERRGHQRSSSAGCGRARPAECAARPEQRRPVRLRPGAGGGGRHGGPCRVDGRVRRGAAAQHTGGRTHRGCPGAHLVPRRAGAAALVESWPSTLCRTPPFRGFRGLA